MLWGVSGVDRLHGRGRIRVPVPCDLPGGSPDTRLHLLSLSGINYVLFVASVVGVCGTIDHISRLTLFLYRVECFEWQFQTM